MPNKFKERNISDKIIDLMLVKEASDYSKRILKAAPIGIATYNYSGQCISLNDSFAEMLGYTKPQLLTRNLEDINISADFNLFQLAGRVIREGHEIRKEIHFPTASGKNTWIDLTFSSFYSNDEPYFLLMIYDLTDRKETEELLRKSEEKFRSSFESMIDPFAIFEAVRNADNNIIDFVIKYINKSGIELAKREASNLNANNVLEFFTHQSSPEIFQDFCDLVQTGKSLNKELIAFDDSTQKIKYAVNLNAVKLGDGFALNCRDITEYKIIENQLRELNKNKDKFLSIIAHDLKSPFNLILGITENLAEDHEQFTSTEKKEFYQASNEHVKNVFNLLEGLLQWANHQSGLSFKPELVQINDLITQILTVFSPLAQSKNISILFDVTNSYNVFCDKKMIETVIRNLLSNAIKFTHTGGEIKIILTNENDITKISIVDSGVGITNQNIQKILESGDKFSTLGTNREKGTGFGLVLVKEFIEKNQGKLTINSVEKEGTTFSFTLPTAPVQ